MGRLIGFVLGGAALALYAPLLFLSGGTLAEYQNWWRENVGVEWYDKLTGPTTAGVLAGIALLLLAVRGRD